MHHWGPSPAWPQEFQIVGGIQSYAVRFPEPSNRVYPVAILAQGLPFHLTWAETCPSPHHWQVDHWVVQWFSQKPLHVPVQNDVYNPHFGDWRICPNIGGPKGPYQCGGRKVTQWSHFPLTSQWLHPFPPKKDVRLIPYRLGNLRLRDPVTICIMHCKSHNMFHRASQITSKGLDLLTHPWKTTAGLSLD